MSVNWDNQFEIRDMRNGEWYWVQKEVLSSKEISSSDKLVYSALAYYSNQHSQSCFPSHRRIANLIDLSERTVYRSIRKLQEKEFIQVIKKSGKVNRYDLLKLTPDKLSPLTNSTHTPDTVAGVPLTNSSTNNNNNNNNKYTKEIWDFYLLKAKTKEKLLPERKKKISARLKSFSVEEIKQAITNCFMSPFHLGENDRGWIANADYIFRSDVVIDKLLNLKVKDTRTIEEKQWDRLMGKDNG